MSKPEISDEVCEVSQSVGVLAKDRLRKSAELQQSESAESESQRVKRDSPTSSSRQDAVSLCL